MHAPLRLSATSLLATLSLLMAACSQEAGPGAAQAPRPAPAAGYVTVTEKPFTFVNELPGRTTLYEVAEVRPQVTGIIEKRLFEEGQTVSSGEALYQIDDKLYQAAVASAKADLATANANLTSTRLTSGRYEKLVKTGAASQQELEDAETALKAAQAQVAAAEAQLETAEINLAYTTIRSPISGRTGRSAVTPGALVTANQTTALVTVRQLDPIYIDLTQSYDELRTLRAAMASGEMKTVGNDQAQVELVQEDGSVYEHTGTLQFSEYAVDETTGSVTLRALFPNPDGALLPGMFVRARLPQAKRENAILVPQKGVARDPTGQATALVIGEGNVVQKRQVETERAVGGQWLIRSGLEAGDKLIIDGLQKIQVGAPVSPVNTEAESAKAEG